MTNLQKAIKIINNRLPKSYQVSIRPYKTVYGMLKKEAKDNKKSYKTIVKWYNNYLTNDETNTYIDTKYYKEKKNNKKHRKEAFRISAIGGRPIKIAKDNIKNLDLISTCFLIIHELGHEWLFRHGYDTYNERWCDEFAIRWTRKMIKEGII